MRKNPLVTLIIPAYNSESKISSTLASVARLEETSLAHEVIVVDDASTDSTASVVGAFVAGRANWSLLRLERNSGSPSRPRNWGIEAAVGKYVYFHDADDELLVSGLLDCVDLAESAGADLVRGWLLVKDDLGDPTAANRLPLTVAALDSRELAAELIGRQSTVAPSLVRTGLLIDNHIRWREDVRMGEDTIFLAEVLASADVIRYSDSPTFIYDRRVQSERSSTQNYDEAALRNHLFVWRTVQDLLSPLQIDYVGSRGTIAVRECLLGLYARRRGDISEDAFIELAGFLQEFDHAIDHDQYKARLSGLYDIVRTGTYGEFCQAIKPRLLIAGYDLKFILRAVPALSEHFQIAVDEWTGHETHDPARSDRLLHWADIVFCDWLLGNATWYADRVRKDQVLVVRGHRFELDRDFGFHPSIARVDRFYSVSVRTLEDFIRVFSISRSTARLLPNWVDLGAHATSDSASRVFRLALIGSVPIRKGYLRALEVLAKLRQEDARFTLDVYGQRPEEVEWIWSDRSERKYFDRCADMIVREGLSDAVVHHGWTDMQAALAETGWVLSTSDDESFHLAPSEGFAAGAQGLILGWPGAKYIYPSRFVFETPDQMAGYILSNMELSTFRAGASEGMEFISDEYGIDRFVESLVQDVAGLLMRRNVR